jgi:hypothetical protein
VETARSAVVHHQLRPPPLQLPGERIGGVELADARVQHAGMVEFLRQGRHDQDRRQRPRFGRDRHQGEEAAGIHPCRVAAKAVSLLGGVAVAGGAAGPAGGEPWPSLRCP